MWVKTLLTAILIALGLIVITAVICAVLGSRRGQLELWLRNGITAAVGVVFVSFVLTAAILSINALQHIEASDTLSGYTPADRGETSESYDPEQTARPIYTPPPGTFITPPPKPTAITGVNYGADYQLTDCNDYVYVMADADLYGGAGEHYPVVGSVSGGATINRKGYNDNWSLVDYGGNYCFIQNALLIVNE